MEQHHQHHSAHHSHSSTVAQASAPGAGPGAGAGAPSAVPLPPAPPSSHSQSHSQSQSQEQTEDPQVLFKTAANALAQLYRRSITPDRRAHSRGYAAALNDVSASLDSLPDHPLSVQSNGRTYVPLDLVKHLVAALGVQASEHNAMLEEHDHPLLMPTLSPMVPGLMGVGAASPVQAPALSVLSSSSAPHQLQFHQPSPGTLPASAASGPSGTNIALSAVGSAGGNSSASASSIQQGSSGSASAGQHASSKTPMFPWMLDGEPTRKRPRDF